MSKKIFVTDTETRKKLNEVKTVPYDVFSRREKLSDEEHLKELIPESEKRKDGRGFSEHRPILMKCGVVGEARGSAYVEAGGTKVLATVIGPIEASQDSDSHGYLRCEVSFPQFSYRSREEQEELGTEAEATADALTRALEPSLIKEDMCNVQVVVSVVVVESDGGVVAGCINAATLAVASARLPLGDLTAAGCVAALAHPSLPSPLLLVDPSASEEQYLTDPGACPSRGLLTLSYMHTSAQVSDCVMSGWLDRDLIKAAVPFAQAHCSVIYAQMQRELAKQVSKIVDLIVSMDRPQEEEAEKNVEVTQQLKRLSTK